MSTKSPSKAQIRAVMAALGRRNKGKRKAMTEAEIRQRREAARRSVQARRSPGVRPGRHPATRPVPPEGEDGGSGLAQSNGVKKITVLTTG